MFIHDLYVVHTYVNVICLWLFALAVSSMFVGLCMLFNAFDRPVRKTLDKYSAYECGFDPFPDARDPFSVKSYPIAVLSLILDVELVFPYPFAISLRVLPLTGVCATYIFILLLVVGYLYEWRKGCLDWAQVVHVYGIDRFCLRRYVICNRMHRHHLQQKRDSGDANVIRVDAIGIKCAYRVCFIGVR